MDPEERANALAVGASGHVVGDLEFVVEIPRAAIVDGEDDKVFRLDVVHVGLVGDTDRAAGDVSLVVGVDNGRRLAGAGEIRVLAVVSAKNRIE